MHHQQQAAQSHAAQGAIGSLSNELPGLDDSDRQHFIFYQDEGGYRATNDSNQPMDTIYYLGVIDITTPYNAIKKAEHFWKGMRADAVSLPLPFPFIWLVAIFLARLPSCCGKIT